ncbi:MAG TPA: hypothetical protein VK814_18830 [Acidobacteriaceae bacterium]|jgi:hypothetical protein|nr:hypothetical protein [Acidobacteriaceae bacterium]
MAQYLETPIKFQFMKVPASWELRKLRRGNAPQDEFAFPSVAVTSGASTLKLSALDGWRVRDAFFGLAEGDNEGLLRFLERVGVWSNVEILSHWSPEVRRHCSEGHPVPIRVAGVWKFRETLRRALVDPKGFKADYAARLGRPETDRQLVTQSGIEYTLRFELTRVVVGVIRTTDAYQMLLATVMFDLAKGIPFTQCARKDCAKPFPLKTAHAKIFCCQYCGHLTSQRKKRARDKRERVKDTR